MNKNKGFTLVELLITLLILAVLAGIVYPIYDKFVMRGHRNEARQALEEIATRMHNNFSRARVYDKAYPEAAEIDKDSSIIYDMDKWTVITPDILKEWELDKAGARAYSYTIAFETLTANEFKVTATAQARQAKDKCKTITIDNKNSRTANGQNSRHDASRECWNS